MILRDFALPIIETEISPFKRFGRVLDAGYARRQLNDNRIPSPSNSQNID